MTVQHFPGHMARAMREIGERLRLVDVVVEVADARLPRSGRNPLLDALIGERPRLLVLNREDLADPHVTRRWIERFTQLGLPVAAACGRDQPSVRRAAGRLAELARGVRARRVARAMVLGLPNAGKSSIINGLLRRAAARTENRPGVTRQLQWFRVSDRLELMDTPGILVPKIADEEAQWKLALIGAVPPERYDPEEIAARFHAWLTAQGRDAPDLAGFASARGFVRRGGAIDHRAAARAYLHAFEEGAFGRITLEQP